MQYVQKLGQSLRMNTKFLLIKKQEFSIPIHLCFFHVKIVTKKNSTENGVRQGAAETVPGVKLRVKYTGMKGGQLDMWRVMSCSMQQPPWQCQLCSRVETEEEECYVMLPESLLLGERSLH